MLICMPFEAWQTVKKNIHKIDTISRESSQNKIQTFISNNSLEIHVYIF